MKLLQIFLVIFILIEHVTGQSSYSISSSAPDSPIVNYYIRKARRPFCHKIEIKPIFYHLEEDLKVSSNSEHQRYKLGNKRSNRLKNGLIEFGWEYWGRLIARKPWLNVDVEFLCYKNPNKAPIEVAKRSIAKRPIPPIGVLLYPNKGRISVAVAVSNRNWHQINVNCRSQTYMNHDGKYIEEHITCFHEAAKIGKGDVILVDCGATLSYGVSDYKCTARTEALGKESLESEELYYYPGFRMKVRKPLKPIVSNMEWKGDYKGLAFDYHFLADCIATTTVITAITPDFRITEAPREAKNQNFHEHDKPFKSVEGFLRGAGFTYHQNTVQPGILPELAVNGIFNDIVMISSTGHKYWAIHRSQEFYVGFVRIYSYSTYRLSKIYLLRTRWLEPKTPSITNGEWEKIHYQHVPYGVQIITHQVRPFKQSTQFAIYSIHPTDDLIFSELEIIQDPSYRKMIRIPWEAGIDYILTVQTRSRPHHFNRQAGDKTGPWTYSDKSYIRFFAGWKTDKIKKKVCKLFKYDALKEFFNCSKSSARINEVNATLECTKSRPDTLKGLAECLQDGLEIPAIEADWPTPDSPPPDTSDIYGEDLSGIFTEPIAESLVAVGAASKGSRSKSLEWMLVVLMVVAGILTC